MGLSEDGEYISKFWLSKDYGIPLKTEMYINGEIISSSKITNMKMGPFDDEIFEIPEGVQINEM